MRVPETIRGSWSEPEKDIPFRWDGDVHNKSLTTAFVVEVSDRKAHFVITRYDCQADEDYRWKGHADDYDIRTAGVFKPWSTQFPLVYRHLLSIAERQYAGNVPEISQLDTIDLDDAPEISPGDMIHIHKTILWGNVSEEDGVRAYKIGAELREVCKLPIPNQPVDEFFARAARLHPRIARQLARTYRKHEAMEMGAQRRIVANEPVRPFADKDQVIAGRHGKDGKYELFRSRSVFGSGPVEDHFVDIEARAAGDYYTELNGVRNFTTTGMELFTPNIAPFGLGTPEDPLYVVSISIHSDTVLCPAVGEQPVMIDVDGQRFLGVKNPELSSNRFQNPGHDVVMDGLRPVEGGHDTFKITEEQSAALVERFWAEYQKSSEIIGKDYETYVMTGESKPLDDLEEEVQAAVEAMRAQSTRVNQIISTVIEGEPILSVPGGAHLLVPRSMLDAVEVTFPGLE